MLKLRLILIVIHLMWYREHMVASWSIAKINMFNLLNECFGLNSNFMIHILLQVLLDMYCDLVLSSKPCAKIFLEMHENDLTIVVFLFCWHFIYCVQCNYKTFTKILMRNKTVQLLLLQYNCFLKSIVQHLKSFLRKVTVLTDIPRQAWNWIDVHHN